MFFTALTICSGLSLSTAQAVVGLSGFRSASKINSARPPSWVAITGKRAAMAERKELPKPSERLGQTNISAIVRLRYLGTSSRSSWPINLILSVTPFFNANCLSISSSGPAPIKTKCTFAGKSVSASITLSFAF